MHFWYAFLAWWHAFWVFGAVAERNLISQDEVWLRFGQSFAAWWAPHPRILATHKRVAVANGLSRVCCSPATQIHHLLGHGDLAFTFLIFHGLAFTFVNLLFLFKAGLAQNSSQRTWKLIVVSAGHVAITWRNKKPGKSLLLVGRRTRRNKVSSRFQTSKIGTACWHENWVSWKSA